MAWTDTQFERLKSLVDQGLSAGQIGGQMGMTRNAIISKVSRSGLRLHGNHAGGWESRAPGAPMPAKRVRRRGLKLLPAERRQKPKTIPPEERAARGAIAAAQIAHTDATELADLAPEDASQAIDFMDLNGHTCRWPIGESRSLSTLRFCGQAPHQERPYCLRHCRMAYRRPSDPPSAPAKAERVA